MDADKIGGTLLGSWPQTIYWGTALAMALAFGATLIVQAFDGRTLDGHVSVWTKPLKFELSLAVHAATLALVVGLLGPANRAGTAMTLVAWAFLAASTLEMGYIILQGARAQQSHFNVGTPFYRAMYSMMAACAVVIIGAAGAIGLAVLADGTAHLSPALRTGIALGLIGGTVLTLVTAFTIGGRMSPFVGDIPAADAHMALTGWSKAGGDLRVSHFLATHMIQALPLGALLLDRLASGRPAMVGVLVFATLWTGLTIVEFRTALGGSASPIARWAG